MSRRRNREQNPQPTRRDFLWKNACAALTLTGMATTIRDLRLINAAAADNIKATPKKKTAKEVTLNGKTLTNDTSSYKALVCIFMFGGNDGNNMIVPNDEYSAYSAQRTNIAIPTIGQPNGLLPLNSLTNDGHTYGLTPAMPELAALFNSGHAAFVLNVGSLLAPITRAEYLAGSVAVPSQLFSHNDQQIEWQTAIEDLPSPTGWGGRMADLVNSLNDPTSKVSMNISVAGANILETGNTLQAYNVSTSGAISLNIPGGTAGLAQQAALSQIVALADPYHNLIEGAYANQMSTAITAASVLNGAINATSNANYWTTPFPTSGLGQQMKMIARLIQAAPASANGGTGLGHQRQIFFASTGGFDTHGAEGGVGGTQYGLLQDVSASMNALYQATVQLGVASSVTQFTASDFSRTLIANTSAGTDHAWGNHHILVGGSIVGQNTYGTMPSLLLNQNDDASNNGRWIPTTSVDQYAATLAKWFGVADSSMATVLPYIGRFSPKYLGFLG